MRTVSQPMISDRALRAYAYGVLLMSRAHAMHAKQNPQTSATEKKTARRPLRAFPFGGPENRRVTVCIFATVPAILPCYSPVRLSFDADFLPNRCFSQSGWQATF